MGRSFVFGLFVLAGLAGVVLVVSEGAAAGTETGGASAIQNDGATGCRWFHLRVSGDSGTPGCGHIFPIPPTPSFDVFDAGGCIGLTFNTGAGGTAPPGQPQTVILDVRFDNSDTVIRTIHNAEPPNDGDTFEFCATSDGTLTGSPRAGTYRLRVQAIRDSGLGQYNINSDSQGHRGAIRASAFASSLTSSSPPGGVKFAYTGSEATALTCVPTQPNGDANVETVRTTVRRGDGTTQAVGATVDLDGGAGFSQAYTVNNVNFQNAEATYGAGCEIVGNSVLLGSPWTRWALTGHGAGITRNSATLVSKADLLTVDPRLSLVVHPQKSEPRTGSMDGEYFIGADELFAWCHVSNARAENLALGAGTVAVSIRNPSGVEQASQSSATGADGWTTSRLQFAAAPPGGVWTVRCVASPTGASATADQVVTFVSSFTEHLKLRLLVDPYVRVNNPTEFFVRVEVGGEPTAPDGVPHIQVKYVAGSPPAWTHLTGGTMVNVLDGTQTVNGALYSFAWTFVDTRQFLVLASAHVNGVNITEAASVHVNPPVASTVICNNCTVPLNQSIVIYADPVVNPLTSYRVFVRTTLNGTGVEPHSTPTIRVLRIEGQRGGPPFTSVTVVPETTMTSVQAGAPILLGDLYVFEWTPSESCVCVYVVSSNITGEYMVQSYSFEVNALPIQVGGFDIGEVVVIAAGFGVMLWGFFRGWPLLSVWGTAMTIGGVVEGIAGTWAFTFATGIIGTVVILWLHALGWPMWLRVFSTRESPETREAS